MMRKETKMTITLTANEKLALRGIISSQYHDGRHPVGNPVWSHSCNLFEKKRSFAGSTSSLVKKGLATKAGVGEDATLTITQLGYDSYMAADAPQNTVDAVKQNTGENKEMAEAA
jgi:hypothetical protein